MGCLFWIGAVCMVVAGVSLHSGNWEDAVSPALIGFAMLVMWWDLRPGKPYKIDSSVNNKIVAWDGKGRYLVQAKTSRQITGPRPHVIDNLPASLTKVGKDLWVVDRVDCRYSETSDLIERNAIPWKKVDGNYSINPRGNTKTGGFLSDVVEGFEHNYIKKDD